MTNLHEQIIEIFVKDTGENKLAIVLIASE